MPASLLMLFAFMSFIFWLICGLLSFVLKNTDTKEAAGAGRFSFVFSVVFLVVTTWLSFGYENRGHKDYEVHVQVDNGRATVNEDIERFDGINLNKQFSQQFYDGEIITIREHDTNAGSVYFERRLELVENKEEIND